MSLDIAIEDVDLNLPKGDSRENQAKANNLHPELNITTTPVNPRREIAINTEPYIIPEYDPWLL